MAKSKEQQLETDLEAARAEVASVHATISKHEREYQERIKALEVEIGQLRNELAKATAPVVVEPAKPQPWNGRALVTVPGCHVGTIDVRIPVATPAEPAELRRNAALEAAANARGIARDEKGKPQWPTAPSVEFVPDDYLIPPPRDFNNPIILLTALKKNEIDLSQVVIDGLKWRIEPKKPNAARAH